MIETLHRAAQYLAAAGNSFLEKQADDGQANLSWDHEFLALSTRPLNSAGNVGLSLNYPDFKLEWVEPGERIISDLELSGKKHSDILEWLTISSEKLGFSNKFKFDLSYELPYTFDDSFIYNQPHPEDFVVFGNNRSNAQKALMELFEDLDEVSEIRVWPHHFDTGGLITVEKDHGEIVKSIGVGLAIPDSLVKDMYYYAAAYNSESNIEYSDLPGLRNGMWVTNGWNGIVLPASNISEEKALIFFKEAVMVLQGILLDEAE